MIQYPRLLQTDGRTFVRPLHPIRTSVELNIIPLSTASLELPEEEVIPARSYVEMFTNLGSAGIYRVRSPQNSYGEDQTASELEHAIVEVGDWLVRAKYDEMKPAGQAMQTIFNHYRGNKWQLGSVSALGSKSIALQANYDDCLSTMLALLDQVPDVMMTFDFSTSPWTVSFKAVDSTVSAEGRMSRNIESARIIYDDSELCTRAYYEYPVAGSDDGTTAPSTAWATMDADTISTYGIIEREVPTGSGFTRSEAEYKVQEYLRKHKAPKISIEMTGEDLSQMTGESLDTFRIGKLFRLALPKYGITIEKPITSMSWDDPYNKPRWFTVNLADPEDTAITFLHDVNANGSSGAASGGGGGGGRRKKQDDEWKMYRHEWEVSDYRLFYEAQRWSRSEEILNKAGLKLNAFGALIYADDVENGIGARINVTAREIRQEVETKTSKASIVAKITDINGKLTSSINIDAERVVIGSESGLDPDYEGSLPGTLTAITTDFTSVRTLLANKIEADYITATRIRSLVDGGSFSSLACTSLSVGGISYAPNGVLKGVRAVNNNGTITFYQKFMSGAETSVITFEKGDTDAAYDQGWNDCVDATAATGAVVLSGYETYAGGRSVTLYLADGTPAGTHIWRYGGTTGTRYRLRDKRGE